jgi:hypothetical protein
VKIRIKPAQHLLIRHRRGADKDLTKMIEPLKMSKSQIKNGCWFLICDLLTKRVFVL